MEFWYTIISVLPFEWVNYSFMKNAMLAVLIIAPIFGLMGTMIVNNKMAFFSDSIGHSALAGIAIGVMLNLKTPLISMVIFSIFFGLAILFIKTLNKGATDTTIGVVSSTVVAVGIVILSSGGGFGKYSVYLIGDILNVTPENIFLLGAILIIVALFWIFIFNKLLLTSFNPSFIKSRGVNAIVYDAAFIVLTAVVVAVSIQWVGILIINSLLILPAAASRNIATNMRQYHIWSLMISFLAAVMGLILSFYIGSATGATIVIVSAIFYAFSFVLKMIKG
jgi:zinc transport system permease protein